MTVASDADAPLRTARALAARQRALARIAPGLVHDLRGPLNAIHLNVELLKTLAGGVEGEAGSKLQRYAGVVAEELGRFQKRFDRFVEQVIPADREEATEVDLRGIVRHVENLLEVQARKERVHLVLEIPDEPVWVEGVADRLRDALLQAAVSGLPRERSETDRTLHLELVESPPGARVVVRAGGGEPNPDGDLLTESARTLWEGQGGTFRGPSADGDGMEISMELPLRESQTRDE